MAPKLSMHGVEIPRIGFGTSQLGDWGEIVATALKLGYGNLDAAWKYGTEKGVGEGIRLSGVPRKDIFLTTKVSHEYLRPAGSTERRQGTTLPGKNRCREAAYLNPVYGGLMRGCKA